MSLQARFPINAWGRLDAAVNPSLSPAQFLDLVWRTRGSMWNSVGVLVTKWGEKSAHEAGLPKLGTFFGCTADGVMEQIINVPRNELPFRSVKDAVWKDDIQRFEEGALLPGWPKILETLLKFHVLRPCRLLDILLAGDSWKIGGMDSNYQLVEKVRQEQGKRKSRSADA